MVLHARRRHRHAANVIPRETVGQAVRWIWAPVVGVWIAMPWLVAFEIGRRSIALRPLWHLPILSWTAAIVIFHGWIATRICWKRMGKSWRMGIDPGEKNPLIATGAYARVRHPIYALSQLMMVSTIVVAPSPAMFVAGAIHIVLMQWEVRREEAHLLMAHGQVYRDYLDRVPRFKPKLTA